MCKNNTLVDGLFIVLFMAIAFSRMENADADLRPIVMFIPYLISYCIFRILSCLNYRWTTIVLVAVISVLCIKELYEGYVQLFMHFGKKNGQDICMGSFSNSGVYGCFLAVCASLFVACGVKAKKRYVRFVLIALTVSALLLLAVTMSRASVLSFAAAMLLLIFNFECCRRFMRKNWIVLSVVILLLGVGAYVVKKPSADGRLLMDRIGLRVIRKNGLKGVGAGYYAGAYGMEQCAFFMELAGDGADDLDISNIPEGMRRVADCPYYAFNEYIRVGVEYGLVAMLLMVALVVVGIVTAYKSGSCLCYPLLALSVFALFSYPFQVGLFSFLFTALMASAGGQAMKKSLCVGFYCLVSLMACTNWWPGTDTKASFFESSPCLYITRDMLTGNNAAVDQNMFFTYGQALNMSGNYLKSDSILKIGATISSDPMFWNVMGNNSLAMGRYSEAESRYIHAFYMVPNRLYPLYLLAKLYHAEGDTSRFLKMADYVESFVPKVESVNTERLRAEIVELKNGYLESKLIE